MKVVSLFSGAGGLDLGFLQAGFDIIWANDISKSACMTYEKNLGLKPVNEDIRKIKHIPNADVLIACNPCQGFSVIGKRDESDKRNLLYREVFRCLRLVRPKYFVMENVKGLAGLYGGKFFRLVLAGLRRAGYRVWWKILDAKNYGAPQHRERIIIVGAATNLEVIYDFPSMTHGPGLRPYVTLMEAISDLPKPSVGEYYSLDYWPFFYMSRNRLAGWDSVSYTIQASARHVPLHPSSPPMQKAGNDKWIFTGKNKNYRRLSVRECSRIQTFPDCFEFLGSIEMQYMLVGNAVPPLLARKLAESIKSLEMKNPVAIEATKKMRSRKQRICQRAIKVVQAQQQRSAMAE